MDIFLLLLGVLIGWGVTSHYYKRSKSDSELSESRRNSNEKWRRSISYFEHMLTAGEWEKRYLENVVTWVCGSDISLKIVIPDSSDEFIESWTEKHPDPRGRRTDIQLRVNDSTIEELPFISLDGGRILVPMPRRVFVGKEPIYFWERDSVEFKVGLIVGYYYIHKTIEGVASYSGIDIEKGHR